MVGHAGKKNAYLGSGESNPSGAQASRAGRWKDGRGEVLGWRGARLVCLPFLADKAQRLIDPLLRPLVLAEVRVFVRGVKNYIR